jgi:hypothetical protein
MQLAELWISLEPRIAQLGRQQEEYSPDERI